MTPSDDVTNGNWDSCKMYVLQELKRINDHLDKMDEKLDKLKEQVTMIQVKVAGIAALAGVIVTIVVNLIWRGAAPRVTP